MAGKMCCRTLNTEPREEGHIKTSTESRAVQGVTLCKLNKGNLVPNSMKFGKKFFTLPIRENQLGFCFTDLGSFVPKGLSYMYVLQALQVRK